MIYTIYISPAVCPSLPPLSLAVPEVWLPDCHGEEAGQAQLSGREAGAGNAPWDLDHSDFWWWEGVKIPACQN